MEALLGIRERHLDVRECGIKLRNLRFVGSGVEIAVKIAKRLYDLHCLTNRR